MKYALKVYGILEVGKRTDEQGHPHQEDCIYPSMEQLSDKERLFILCDGMGGHDSGEVASSTVCQTMSTYIVHHMATDTFSTSDLQQALTAAFDALDAHDTSTAKKMGTTLALLKLHKEGGTIAHMGDSRVYHIRPGKSEIDTNILFVTEDHSLVNCLVKIGELTKEEARHSKQKNIITRAMQPHSSRPKPDITLITDIRPDDYFVLCSDGMLEQDEMEDGTVLKRIFSKCVPTDEEKVAILKGATAENNDNHSALIIHITDVIGKV